MSCLLKLRLGNELLGVPGFEEDGIRMEDNFWLTEFWYSFLEELEETLDLTLRDSYGICGMMWEYFHGLNWEDFIDYFIKGDSSLFLLLTYTFGWEIYILGS